MRIGDTVNLSTKKIDFVTDLQTDISDIRTTVDPKYFDYKFLATLDERGQGIPNDRYKRGGRKG